MDRIRPLKVYQLNSSRRPCAVFVAPACETEMSRILLVGKFPGILSLAALKHGAAGGASAERPQTFGNLRNGGLTTQLDLSESGLKIQVCS